MSRSLRAGAFYFAIVFVVGFMLGTVRVMVTDPAFGEFAAMLIEVPLILAASWVVCGWVVSRFAVPANLSSRAAMGMAAFVLLMLAELALSMLLFGRSFAEYVVAYREPAKQIGLISQLLFAAMPLARRQASPSASRA